jgi:hypothetical protein
MCVMSLVTGPMQEVVYMCLILEDLKMTWSLCTKQQQGSAEQRKAKCHAKCDQSAILVGSDIITTPPFPCLEWIL